MGVNSQVKKLKRGEDKFEPDLNVHTTATLTLINFAALQVSNQTNFLGRKKYWGREFVSPPFTIPTPKLGICKALRLFLLLDTLSGKHIASQWRHIAFSSASALCTYD